MRALKTVLTIGAFFAALFLLFNGAVGPGLAMLVLWVILSLA